MKVIEWFKDRDGLELIIMGAITGLVLMILFAGYFQAKEEAEFMRECEQDRPKYECTAMWRSGDKPTPVIIVQ